MECHPCRCVPSKNDDTSTLQPASSDDPPKVRDLNNACMFDAIASRLEVKRIEPLTNTAHPSCFQSRHSCPWHSGLLWQHTAAPPCLREARNKKQGLGNPCHLPSRSCVNRKLVEEPINFKENKGTVWNCDKGVAFRQTSGRLLPIHAAKRTRPGIQKILQQTPA